MIRTGLDGKGHAAGSTTPLQPQACEDRADRETALISPFSASYAYFCCLLHSLAAQAYSWRQKSFECIDSTVDVTGPSINLFEAKHI